MIRIALLKHMPAYRRNTCPECKTNRRPSGHNCPACHATYMRAWRATHTMTAEQRKRANARSYAHVYLKRGKLKKEPCEWCGSLSVQMHHDDYNRPLVVRWFCADCHRTHHQS